MSESWKWAHLRLQHMKPESQKMNFVVTHRQPSDCRRMPTYHFFRVKASIKGMGAILLRESCHERIFEELADERCRKIHSKDLFSQPDTCQHAPHVSYATMTQLELLRRTVIVLQTSYLADAFCFSTTPSFESYLVLLCCMLCNSHYRFW